MIWKHQKNINLKQRKKQKKISFSKIILKRKNKNHTGQVHGTLWVILYVYLILIIPGVSLQFDIPNKVCTSKNIFYDHLYIFESKAFVYLWK